MSDKENKSSATKAPPSTPVDDLKKASLPHSFSGVSAALICPPALQPTAVGQVPSPTPTELLLQSISSPSFHSSSQIHEPAAPASSRSLLATPQANHAIMSQRPQTGSVSQSSPSSLLMANSFSINQASLTSMSNMGTPLSFFSSPSSFSWLQQEPAGEEDRRQQPTQPQPQQASQPDPFSILDAVAQNYISASIARYGPLPSPLSTSTTAVQATLSTIAESATEEVQGPPPAAATAAAAAPEDDESEPESDDELEPESDDEWKPESGAHESKIKSSKKKKGVVAKKRQSSKKHGATKKGEVVFQCEICGHTMKSKKGLKFHKDHNICTRPKPVLKSKLRCPHDECKHMTFPNQKRLENHIAFRHGPKPNKTCPHCNHTFARKRMLDHHIEYKWCPVLKKQLSDDEEEDEEPKKEEDEEPKE